MLVRAYPKIIIALFIAFLLSPGLITLFGKNESVSTSEKRRLAPFPKLEWRRQSISAFPRDFEKYFRDHFGLREKLVVLHNTAFLQMFRTSPRHSVIYGSDGWLYLASMGVLSDFIGQGYGLNEREIRYLGQILSDRQMWLQSQGIHYLYVPVPNKMDVYPEYLPPLYRRFAGNSLYSRLIKELSRRREEMHFLDLLAIFYQAKGTDQLYYKSDTHWNEAGAYLGYRRIIEKLQAMFPDIRPISPDQLTSSDVFYPGDLALQLHLENQIKEKAKQYSLKHDRTETRLQKLDNSEMQYGIPGKIVLTEIPTAKHTALIIHDSFGNHLRKYFSQHFQKTYFITGTRFTEAIPFIRQIQPDIVIDLHVARNIPSVVIPEPRITSYAAKKTFEELSTTMLVLKEDEIRKLAAANLRFTGNNGPAALQAINNDPQLLVKLPTTISRQPGVLRIVMTSPAATTFQVFYTQDPKNIFFERASLTWPVVKGRNEIYMRLPDFVPFDRLRIDPGKKPGQYVIEKLDLRL